MIGSAPALLTGGGGAETAAAQEDGGGEDRDGVTEEGAGGAGTSCFLFRGKIFPLKGSFNKFEEESTTEAAAAAPVTAADFGLA